MINSESKQATEMVKAPYITEGDTQGYVLNYIGMDEEYGEELLEGSGFPSNWKPVSHRLISTRKHK